MSATETSTFLARHTHTKSVYNLASVFFLFNDFNIDFASHFANAKTINIHHENLKLRTAAEKAASSCEHNCVIFEEEKFSRANCILKNKNNWKMSSFDSNVMFE